MISIHSLLISLVIITTSVSVAIMKENKKDKSEFIDVIRAEGEIKCQ